jgi:hypothetical protein
MAIPPGVLQTDQFNPTPGRVIREQRGTALIVNRTRYLPGSTRIKKLSNTMQSTPHRGTGRVRNPLQYTPAFQIEPLQTNTELKVEFQRGVTCIVKHSFVTQNGVTSIRNAATRGLSGASRIIKVLLMNQAGVSRIQNTTSDDLLGVSNIITTLLMDQTGVSRVQSTTSGDLLGGTLVQVTTTHTQNGVSNIA